MISSRLDLRRRSLPSLSDTTRVLIGSEMEITLLLRRSPPSRSLSSEVSSLSVPVCRHFWQTVRAGSCPGGMGCL